jgi:signal transduction histidine kinase
VLDMLIDGRRAIMLPLHSQIAIPSALVAFFDPGDGVPAAAEETGLLESLAGHASLALDRVQAAADRVDLEDVSRRDRVARDLHDVVIQRLFATGLQLEGMRMRLDDTAALERIDLAIEDIDTTIRHIREAIFAADQATPEGS